MFDRLFLAHPRSVGENYLEHQRTALSFAIPLFGASLACFVHAFLPNCFERTGSETVKRLYARMIVNRVRANAHQQETVRLVLSGQSNTAIATPAWDVGL